MKCFVIMPFADEFDAIYSVVRDAAAMAVSDEHFHCYWLKDVQSAGRITDDILHGLHEATFCIADVSCDEQGPNANVMWETGYAMALGKPTILIGQSLETLPFDLKSHRVLEYSNGDELRPKLCEAVRQTLTRYALTGTSISILPQTPLPESRIITVTGSMRARKDLAMCRLERMLMPYLSEATTWLVGTVGTVDLAVAQYLLEHQQRVIAIGYNSYDYCAEMRTLIEEGRLLFLDASIEPIPKGLNGPNERDILFCSKSDLVVLVWDGVSPGTQSLMQFLQSQGIATLFVTL